MASIGSAVQAACRKAREDALARAGTNDFADAMRRSRPPNFSADATLTVFPAHAATARTDPEQQQNIDKGAIAESEN